MKLKFKNQNFQTDAVNAVAELFKGQEILRSTFEITPDRQISLMQNDFGIGNLMSISSDQLNNNMHEIQKRNNLPLSNLWTDLISSQTNETVTVGADIIRQNEHDRLTPQFCIEMETGTGKTYVYTKTIFELNKRYGFSKFIIVVPSVAIREGVYKSFEVTKEHFQNQYDNVPYDYFIYNSSKCVCQVKIDANGPQKC